MQPLPPSERYFKRVFFAIVLTDPAVRFREVSGALQQPYMPLSLFYLFYFGALGALVPYWPVYLHSLGLCPSEIGALIAIFSITRVIAPNVCGFLSDYACVRMPIVRLATGLAVASFLLVLGVRSFWGLAAVMSLFTFFWNAVLPQMEATLINHLGTDRYGQVRLWGSIGFIAAVLLMGPVVDHFGIQVLPFVLLILYTGLWFSSLLVPEAPIPTHDAPPQSFLEVLRHPGVGVFLFVCFLMQASHGPYYTFYSMYLENHGNSHSLISALWALGVLCEVGVFLVVGRWLSRYGTIRVLMITLLLASVRWILIGAYVDSVPILVFAQVLHAATFGAYHATGIRMVHQYFTGSNQVRGQALYSSLGFGAGGMVGSLYAGYLWDWVGAAGTFYLAALLSASAAMLVWYRLRE